MPRIQLNPQRHTAPATHALAGLLIAALSLLTIPSLAEAQMVPAPPPLNQSRNSGGSVNGELPDAYKGVDITQNIEAQLPLDATFVDSEGKTVKLGDYFDGEHPVLLNLGYYDCPGLCPLIWAHLSDSFAQMKWTPGEQFQVVTISFSHVETTEMAKKAKAKWVGRTKKPEVAKGWHFLTGKKDQIERVAKTVGFGYKPLPGDKTQFSHKAAIMVLSPDGRVMRYLGGIGKKYPPSTLRLSMVDASEGKVGSLVDQFTLFCCTFDPNSNTYQWARWVMRAGGGLTMLFLGLGVALMVKVGRRRRQAVLQQMNNTGDDPTHTT